MSCGRNGITPFSGLRTVVSSTLTTLLAPRPSSRHAFH